MFTTRTFVLAAAALALVAVSSLASAGIIMPTRSIGAMQMHSVPSAAPSLGASSLRSERSLIDPNDRNNEHFKRKGSGPHTPIESAWKLCVKKVCWFQFVCPPGSTTRKNCVPKQVCVNKLVDCG